MSVYRHKASPFWHYDFQVGGQRFHGSTGCADERLARDFEKDLKEKARQGVGLAPVSELTVDLAIGEYWERHARHRKSARDIEIKLERLVTRLGARKPLGTLGNRDLADYVAVRRNEVGAASVNRELVLLRAALFYCRDKLDARIPKINWKDHMLPEPRGRTRYLSEKEERRLLKALRADYRPLVEFCLLTGCRISSARNLKWGDISGDRVRLFVKSKIQGDWHDLPLTADMKAIFSKVKGHHPEHVFTYKCIRQNRKDKGKRYPFTATNWRREWGRALAAAKITDFRFHDLRHTAGTRIMRESKNIAVAQRVLGHSDISSTMRYAHVADEDVLMALSRTKSPKKKANDNKNGRLKKIS